MTEGPRILLAVVLMTGIILDPIVAHCFSWTDTFLGYRYGATFHDPGKTADLQKHVLQVGHADRYSVGQNLVNLDILQSDSEDPAKGSSNGATEFYLTYRHQLLLGEALEQDLKFGPIRELAVTAGFDVNTKTSPMQPFKRLLVAGPTLKLDVPGFLDISLLIGREWNHCGLGAPACPNDDIAFDPQLIVSASWGIPFQVSGLPLKFQGFLNHLSEKGKDYAGVPTKAETLMRTSLMIDVGQIAAGKPNTFFIGPGYELWRNKFGAHSRLDGSTKAGIDTDAPTIQMEWHF